MYLPSDLLKASIKNHPGYVLYGNPPRWHLFSEKEHGDKTKLHYHATKTYHIAAAKKLMEQHNAAKMSAADMRAEVEHEAGRMQGQASANAAVYMWRSALLAGKKPTPAQERAFRAMAEAEPDRAAKMLRGIAEKLGNGDASAGMQAIHAQGNTEAEDAKTQVLKEALDHLKEDTQQKDIPPKEHKEDQEMISRIEAVLKTGKAPEKKPKKAEKEEPPAGSDHAAENKDEEMLDFNQVYDLFNEAGLVEENSIFELFEMDRGLDPTQKEWKRSRVKNAILWFKIGLKKKDLRGQVDAILKLHGDDPVGVEVKRPDADRWAIVIPDASSPGKFRYSAWDQRGFYTHEEFDTAREALDNLVKNGYTEWVPGSLDKMSQTKEWADGMKASAEIQKHNAESFERSKRAGRTDQALQGKPDDIAAMLDQLILPDTNSNAKTVNKKVEKLRALIEAGDPEAVRSATWGINTYGIKLAAAAAKAADLMPAKPAKPQAPTESPAAPQAPKESEPEAGGLEGIGKLIDEAVLPATNSNAKSVNAQLDLLTKLVGSGNPNVVLAHKWGINTYGRRMDKLAKRVAGMMSGLTEDEARDWALSRTVLAPLVAHRMPQHLVGIEHHPSLDDPRVRESVKWMADTAGWAEVGGLAMRNDEGDVVGRTSWVPREEWYRERPEGLREQHFVGAARKLETGGKLSLPEREALNFMIGYINAQDMGGTDWDLDLDNSMEYATNEVMDYYFGEEPQEEESDMEILNASSADSDWASLSESEREAELDKIFG